MQGLQVWDENGNVTLDISSRVTRVFGFLSIQKPYDEQKTITDLRLLEGKAWFAYQQTRHHDVVDVVISGSTITLKFIYKSSTSNDPAYRAYSIIYGVY